MKWNDLRIIGRRKKRKKVILNICSTLETQTKVGETKSFLFVPLIRILSVFDGFPDVGKRRQRNILCKSTNYLTKITEKRKQIRQRFNINFLFHVLHILDHKRPSHVRKLFNEFNTRKNISLSETWHFNILLFHIRHELKQLITWSTKSRLNGPPLLLQSIKCDNSRTHRESFIIALSLTRVKYLIKRNIRQVFAIRCMTRNSFDIA